MPNFQSTASKIQKTVCTSPFSDTSSLSTEHHISGILGCVQCCSNTEQAAGSSIPPGNNWSTNLGQVRRATLIYKSYGRETGSAAVSAVCRVDRRLTLPQRCCVKDKQWGTNCTHLSHTQGCQTTHGQSGFFLQHRNWFITEVTQWLLLQEAGWRFSQGAAYSC